jgi:hypothetical protein
MENLSSLPPNHDLPITIVLKSWKSQKQPSACEESQRIVLLTVFEDLSLIPNLEYSKM